MHTDEKRIDCALGLLYAALILMAVSRGTLGQGVATQPATKKLVVAEYQAFAMGHQGEVGRGRALFLEEGRLGCGGCHTVDGKGGRAGPDLRAIGDKFGRSDLVESILAPSAMIAVGYSTSVIRTRKGEMYDGILVESNDQGVGIVQGDGRLVRIGAGEIAQRRTTEISLMPEGLQNGMTLVEFADLIEYMASLKAPNVAEREGMPAEIGALERPIGLSPFNLPAHKFEHPVWFGPVTGAAGAFAVVEHETGKIWILEKSGGGEMKSVFLETGRVMKGTRGLLGIAFHPQYAKNRRYFIVKHFVEEGRFSTHVLEGEAGEDLKRDGGKGLRRVLKMEASANVHYGGGLQFGPEGYLYIGMGDTGPQQDPNGNGQNMGVLLGKMLRIDVDHGEERKLYAVPKDNPFVGRAGVRPEIWASGFREPWRFSFDPATGELWVGDVGQDLFEEVDIVRRGENYGWNVYEGFERFSNRYLREGERFVPPVFAYTRKYGVSVTGGFVYRGKKGAGFE
ncbi:MAG TPA: PQQ-dependent sugar dehydrogenase, partial [Tepidisphaeraceae bacterium]|nr:PQQ-dependent sugar dehydrogenase [Tepidisphaeraceae bacterium]